MRPAKSPAADRMQKVGAVCLLVTLATKLPLEWASSWPPGAFPIVVALRITWFVMLVVSGVYFWKAAFRHSHDRKRHALGQCQECGYDLRETPERCPECGTAAGSLARRSWSRIDLKI